MHSENADLEYAKRKRSLGSLLKVPTDDTIDSDAKAPLRSFLCSLVAGILTWLDCLKLGPPSRCNYQDPFHSGVCMRHVPL